MQAREECIKFGNMDAFLFCPCNHVFTENFLYHVRGIHLPQYSSANGRNMIFETQFIINVNTQDFEATSRLQIASFLSTITV